jgi:hypothetical protein
MYGELGVIATDLPDVVASELRQLTLGAANGGQW